MINQPESRSRRSKRLARPVRQRSRRPGCAKEGPSRRPGLVDLITDRTREDCIGAVTARDLDAQGATTPVGVDGGGVKRIAPRRRARSESFHAAARVAEVRTTGTGERERGTRQVTRAPSVPPPRPRPRGRSALGSRSEYLTLSGSRASTVSATLFTSPAWLEGQGPLRRGIALRPEPSLHQRQRERAPQWPKPRRQSRQWSTATATPAVGSASSSPQPHPQVLGLRFTARSVSYRVTFAFSPRLSALATLFAFVLGGV